MDGCSILFLICIFGFVGYQIVKTQQESNDAQEREIKSFQDSLSKDKNTLKSLEGSITETIKSSFSPNNSIYRNYESTCKTLDSSIEKMQFTIEEMKRTNDRLTYIKKSESQIMSIEHLEMKVNEQLKVTVDAFKSFSQKISALPASRMLDEKNYGKINKMYWDDVAGLQRESVENYLSRCEKLLEGTLVEKIFEINIEEVLKCVWFFATEKTFSASDFQRAEKVFSRLYKQSHADVIIADLYAKKKMAGEDALRDAVRDLLKTETDSSKLTLIASGLMWMNAYQSENIVLQHMLTTGKEMTAKTQERLHSLSNGGGAAPIGYDVESVDNTMYFDVSALAWKDDEYIGFFENLVFQDKELTYSLAIRDENKELFIPQGINVPGRRDVLKKMKDTLVEEYGSSAMAKEANCIALSGSGKEAMECILVSSTECKQMGILIHVAKIGKKLIIKFYTLFMPMDLNLMDQKQQALSMSKKLSPTVTMWESSLKDTMLRAIEQLLNVGAESDGSIKNNDSKVGTEAIDNPIF